MPSDLWYKVVESNEGLRAAAEILIKMSQDPKEWEKQEKRKKVLMEYQIERKAVYDKGKERSKIEDARGMKSENIPVETIVKITGLTAEQVEAL